MTEGLNRGMTPVSGNAFAAATARSLSPAQAAAALSSVRPRGFAEILRRFAPGEADRDTLVSGLCKNRPSRSRASMDRKVRGWLNGQYQPTAREDLLELCFLLRLTVEDADAFLSAAGEEGLHWRDPRELAYAFALRWGMSYPDAAALYHRVSPSGETPRTGADPSFSPAVRREAALLETEAELRQYVCSAWDRLGAYHNMAYLYFMDYLSLLERPRALSLGEEEPFSIRRIVETYLDSHFPPDWDKKALDRNRKEILAGWPNEVTLSLMKNRQIDVNRKTLILLFLTTDGGEDAAEDWQEEKEDADADFRSSYLRINQMLSACSYRMLDPRNPFDWLVLYCLRVSSDPEAMEGMSERLMDVLDVLFAAAPGQ